MTPVLQETEQRRDRTTRLNTWLYVLVVLLVCAATVVGVFVVKPAFSDESSSVTSERTSEDVPATTYAEVLEAARNVALAFTNVDYRDLDESLDKMLAGATGDFAKQYKSSTEGLRTVMTENKSVMKSKVLAAGIVTISEFTARALVSTSGTVTNTSTKGDKSAREMRLQLDLSKVKGKWLVNDVQFVG
ncbi:Mce-associated membrane protein [Nocardioides daedukensis]|uniref:Mce-associated membrane protein n=1 Tax=Nocardioides daedukensis TaxID=634462 RepID=A0A7Y9UT92_9ACTN|nr:hypothetical protein [Nocardioides daedukensis]NYG57584.1 Mce-associated membrane protein [Nocardioides daedukensis]